jgi:hypothetical protein
MEFLQDFYVYTLLKLDLRLVCLKLENKAKIYIQLINTV